jgi:hypothetical protein
MKTRLALFGALMVMTMVPAGAAHADETHRDSHNAPRVTLVSTGQIDDPMEDVLEHPAVLGRTYVFD